MAVPATDTFRNYEKISLPSTAKVLSAHKYPAGRLPTKKLSCHLSSISNSYQEWKIEFQCRWRRHVRCKVCQSQRVRAQARASWLDTSSSGKIGKSSRKESSWKKEGRENEGGQKDLNNQSPTWGFVLVARGVPA